MDKLLSPAFEGWSIKEYYLFNVYSRSLYYANMNFQGKGRWDYKKLGCLDVFRIVDLLLNLRIIGDVKRVVIEPIKTSQKAN